MAEYEIGGVKLTFPDDMKPEDVLAAVRRSPNVLRSLDNATIRSFGDDRARGVTAEQHYWRVRENPKATESQKLWADEWKRRHGVPKEGFASTEEKLPEPRITRRTSDAPEDTAIRNRAMDLLSAIGQAGTVGSRGVAGKPVKDIGGAYGAAKQVAYGTIAGTRPSEAPPTLLDALVSRATGGTSIDVHQAPPNETPVEGVVRGLMSMGAGFVEPENLLLMRLLGPFGAAASKIKEGAGLASKIPAIARPATAKVVQHAPLGYFGTEAGLAAKEQAESGDMPGAIGSLLAMFGPVAVAEGLGVLKARRTRGAKPVAPVEPVKSPEPAVPPMRRRVRFTTPPPEPAKPVMEVKPDATTQALPQAAGEARPARPVVPAKPQAVPEAAGAPPAGGTAVQPVAAPLKVRRFSDPTGGKVTQVIDAEGKPAVVTPAAPERASQVLESLKAAAEAQGKERLTQAEMVDALVADRSLGLKSKSAAALELAAARDGAQGEATSDGTRYQYQTRSGDRTDHISWQRPDGRPGELAGLRFWKPKEVPNAKQVPMARTVPERVQRIEEVGDTPGTVDKPHGLYTSPADVETPHAELGGIKHEHRTNPDANVLVLTEDPTVVVRRGAGSAGSGVHAFKHLAGDDAFASVKQMTVAEAKEYGRSKYPTVDWDRYYDTQEVIEALGGMMARDKGYDAIWMPDAANPAFDEFVGLTKRAFLAPKEVPNAKQVGEATPVGSVRGGPEGTRPQAAEGMAEARPQAPAPPVEVAKSAAPKTVVDAISEANKADHALKALWSEWHSAEPSARDSVMARIRARQSEVTRQAKAAFERPKQVEVAKAAEAAKQPSPISAETGKMGTRTRPWQAGRYKGTVEFESDLQRDLYDAGAAWRKRVEDQDNLRTAKVKDTDSRIERLANTLGMTRDAVIRRALDTHADVREQMSGLKEGETRKVRDTVGQKAVAPAALQPAPAKPLTAPEATTKPPETPPRGTKPALTTPEPAAKAQEGAKSAAPEGLQRAKDVYDVPTETLTVDPERFQYKVEGVGKEGETATLKSVGKWDPNMAGTVLVWRDPSNGQTYVVNGHHRVGLAKRLGVERVRVKFLDVPTAEDARAYGALTNIAEGHGTAIDAAKFFRDSGGGPEDLTSRGVSTRSPLVRDGLKLAGLEEGLWRGVVLGQIEPSIAAEIGGSGLKHTDQRSIWNALQKEAGSGREVSAKFARNLIEAAKNAPRETVTEHGLFGEETFERASLAEVARVTTWLQKQLATVRGKFRTVSNQETADLLASADNTLNVGANARITQDMSEVLGVFNALKDKTGPVRDVVNEAARRLAAGGSDKDVYGYAWEALGDAIHQEVPSVPAEALRNVGARHRGWGGSTDGSLFADFDAEAKPTSAKGVEAKAAAQHLQDATDAVLEAGKAVSGDLSSGPNILKAMPHIERAARSIYMAGKTTYQAWAKWMTEKFPGVTRHLKTLWEKVRASSTGKAVGGWVTGETREAWYKQRREAVKQAATKRGVSLVDPDLEVGDVAAGRWTKAVEKWIKSQPADQHEALYAKWGRSKDQVARGQHADALALTRWLSYAAERDGRHKLSGYWDMKDGKLVRRTDGEGSGVVLGKDARPLVYQAYQKLFGARKPVNAANMLGLGLGKETRYHDVLWKAYTAYVSRAYEMMVKKALGMSDTAMPRTEVMPDLSEMGGHAPMSLAAFFAGLRSFTASGENSAVLNQAFPMLSRLALMERNPVEAARVIGRGIGAGFGAAEAKSARGAKAKAQAFVSDAGFQRSMEALENVRSPLLEQFLKDHKYEAMSLRELAEEAGLYFRHFGTKNRLSAEELFAESWPERIPGVGSVARVSDRMFSSTIDHAVLQVFRHSVENMIRRGLDPIKDMDALVQVAKSKNVHTGRGDVQMYNALGEKGGKAAQAVLYAPRNKIAQYQFALWEPVKTAYNGFKGLRGDKQAAYLASEQGKDLVSAVGGMALLTLIRLGAEKMRDPDTKVDLNPVSTTFGRVVTKGRSYDYSGGKAAVIRTVMRGLLNRERTTGGREGPINRYSWIGGNVQAHTQYVAQGKAPLLSLVDRLVQTPNKPQVGWGDAWAAVAEMLTPFWWSELGQSAALSTKQGEGAAAGVARGAGGFFGERMNIQKDPSGTTERAKPTPIEKIERAFNRKYKKYGIELDL